MRLVRLGLLAVALVALVFVTSASGSSSRCTLGISSIGPAVLIHGHLDIRESDLVPHTKDYLAK